MNLYVIAGPAGSGKNLFGTLLKEELKKYSYKPCILHLTEPLYNYAKNHFDWDERSGEKPREFLQKMGIEIIKEKLHKNYFLLDRLSEDIEILSNFFDTFIITDCRLIMELTELKKRYDNVITIHLIRLNYDNGLNIEEKNHITEIELEDYHNFDYEIENTSIENLKEIVHKIVKEQEVSKHE